MCSTLDACCAQTSIYDLACHDKTLMQLPLQEGGMAGRQCRQAALAWARVQRACWAREVAC